jgi:hypothetical protein
MPIPMHLYSDMIARQRCIRFLLLSWSTWPICFLPLRMLFMGKTQSSDLGEIEKRMHGISV